MEIPPTTTPQGRGLTRGGTSNKTAVSDTFAAIELCCIPTDPSILFVEVFFHYCGTL